MCLLAAAAFCQAQFSIGGSVGVGYDKTKPDIGNDVTILQLSISPNINYMFNDKIGLGFELGFYYEKDEDKKQYGNEKLKIAGWSVAPYVRSVVCKFNKFNFYADWKFYVDNEQVRSESADKDICKILGLGVNIVPGVCYNINDRCSVHAMLNIVSFGYNYSKLTDVTDQGTHNEPITENTNIGINVNGNTPLNIGFFYTL